MDHLGKPIDDENKVSVAMWCADEFTEDMDAYRLNRAIGREQLEVTDIFS